MMFVLFNSVFVTFPCGILGQVWYLIVSIPDSISDPTLISISTASAAPPDVKRDLINAREK